MVIFDGVNSLFFGVEELEFLGAAIGLGNGVGAEIARGVIEAELKIGSIGAIFYDRSSVVADESSESYVGDK